MAIRGQPERRRSRSFPLVVAWLTGKITGVGLWPGSCFSPVFYRKKQEAFLQQEAIAGACPFLPRLADG
jgi:hypothetical protein